MTIQKRGFNRRSTHGLSGRFAPWLWALWLGVLPLSAVPQSNDEINEKLAKDPFVAEMLRDNPLQGMAIIAKLKYGVSADPYDGNNEMRLTEHAGGECAKRGQTINQECIDRGVLDWDCRQRHNPNPNETPDQCIERRLAAGPSWSGLVPAAKPQGAVSAPPKPTEAPRVDQSPALGDDPDAAGDESAEDAPAESVTDESTEPVEQTDSSAVESGEVPEEAATTDTGDMDEPSDASESADDESTGESSNESTDESSGDEESDLTTDDVADSEDSEEAEERP